MGGNGSAIGDQCEGAFSMEAFASVACETASLLYEKNRIVRGLVKWKEEL